MPWPPADHPLADAYRRRRTRQIAFLRSEPDPDNPLTTEEEMDRLFGGLPDPEDEDGQS